MLWKCADSFESRGRGRGAKCHRRNMGLNRFLQFLILLVAVYLSSTIGVAADESPGSVLLDQLETEVTVLKDQVEQNYRQKCGMSPQCFIFYDRYFICYGVKGIVN